MRAEASTRSLRWLAYAVALAGFGWLFLRFDFVCDDAFISFRYARNLARGHGLVYNVGAPPVEGYSELLWVLAMAVVEVLRGDPVVVSRVLSGAAGVALVVLTVRLAERRVGASPAALLGTALFVGTLPPLAVWSSGGMGTGPFALAVLVAWERLFGEPGRPRAVGAAVACVACVLLRADGAWWVAAVTLPALVARDPRTRGALRSAAAFAAGVAAAAFLAHFGWRLSTYGDWMPNTARVKLGLSARAIERGFAYVASFFLAFPSLAVAAILPLAFLREVRGRALGPASFVLGATVLYAVLVGGDFMCFGRFLVPGLPFLALLLAGALEGARRRLGRVAAGAVAASVSALALAPAFDLHVVPERARAALQFRWNADEFHSELGQWKRMTDQSAEWADLGRALARHTDPDDSLVYGAIGAVGYYSGLFLYDRNGLVTREVALRDPNPGPSSPGHDKSVDESFFLAREPTWLNAFLYPEDPRRYGLPTPADPRLVGPLPTAARSDAFGPLVLWLFPGPGRH